MDRHSKHVELIVDVASIQISWLAAAWLLDQATPWLLLILLIRLYYARDLQQHIGNVLVIAIAGVAMEGLLVVGGVYSYDSVYLLPLWLPLLWALFALTFFSSMRWLMRIPLILQVLLGAVSGALTYRGAAALGAIDFHLPLVISLSIVGLSWAVALPFFATRSTPNTAGALQ